jgi:hypothetical protein
MKGGMSYTVTLECGCTVYVACHPLSRVAHARVIERVGNQCNIRRHEIGLKLWVWELLPQSSSEPVERSGVPPERPRR